MIRLRFPLVGLALITATSSLVAPVLGDPPPQGILPPIAPIPIQTRQSPVVRDLSRLPLSFESNQGQTDARVSFLTHTADSALFLTPSEAVFSLPTPRSEPLKESFSRLKHREIVPANRTVSRSVVRMQMVGADPKAKGWHPQPLPGRANYFIGEDRSRWHAGIPTFERVGFQQVYHGIDLVYYGNQRNLEYDFVVAPHADPKQIRLHFAGAQAVRVNAEGDLIVRASGRELRWRRPVVYQQEAKQRHSVAARFRLKTLPNGQKDVRFALGRYDPAHPLVIDPILTYSTYLGGSLSGNETTGMALDSSGSVYITGFTTTVDFPITSGVFQTNSGPQGSETAFVTKLNSTGTALVYSTFLGGSNINGSNGYSSTNAIAVDSSGNAYIVGTEYALDFPITPGAYQTVVDISGFSPFVTKLNSTGTAVIYSTFLGGPTETINSIAVDSGGNAYLTGSTTSTGFPTTPGAFQTTKRSTSASPSPFITKLNADGAALVYSTYLGGSGGTGQSNGDVGKAITVDSSGIAYITGYTYSYDFPTTPGAFQLGKVLLTGQSNAFVTKLNAAGSGLLYSTYLGGNGLYGNEGVAIAVDSNGSAYVAGSTISADFPTTPGAYQKAIKAPAYASNLFITRFNATGTALLYSTYLGGSSGETARGIALDSVGNAYITGFTASTDFPTTPGAFLRVYNKQGQGNYNVFVTKLNTSGSALLYSTYLGGSNGNDVSGITVDSSNNVYVAGDTISTLFPTTPGAFQPHIAASSGNPNSYVTKLSAIPIFPDFNNDGNVDLFIQNSTTSQIASWFMHGSSWISGAYFSQTPPSDYALVGAGDFSGNGATTLVLQSRTSNQIAFWYTNGTNNAAISGGNFVNTTPPTGWKVVGIGDFNQDGKSDLVLQNQTSNQVAIWFMNGYLYSGGVLMPFTPPSGWTVAGVGDFNADGFPDLVFQNQTTGQIAIWYMNGSTYEGGAVMTTVPASGWKVVGVGDYNGDGYADLLFQNQTTNQGALWYLTNGAFAGGATLSLAPPAGWKIVGPR